MFPVGRNILGSVLTTVFSAVIATALVGTSASAGTLLRLNSGNFETLQLQNSMATLDDLDLVRDFVADFIIQYKNKITEKDKTLLQQQGFEIFGYLPDDALVVRGTSAGLSHFVKLPSSRDKISSFIPYRASFKISADLAGLLRTSSAFNQSHVVHLLVHTFKASETTSIAQKIALTSPQVKLEVVHGTSIQATVPSSAILLVAGFTGVVHLQRVPVIRPLQFVIDEGAVRAIESAASPGDYSDLSGFESGLKVMKADVAWAQGFTGKGQIVAVSDTGLDSGNIETLHSDFQGALLQGLPLGLQSQSWVDIVGHGTHVAGSIVGRGTASKGLLRGAAWESRLVDESMWSTAIDNLSIPSNLSDMYLKSVSDGASVHSNSWGAMNNMGVYDHGAQQVDEFMFSHPDMLLVFAAGNEGVDADRDGRVDPNSVGSPATAKNVLTVGASKNKVSSGGIQGPISKLSSALDNWPMEPLYSSGMSDNDFGLAAFSGRGPTADGRIKPDIVAPGANILSVRSQQNGAGTLWGAYNKDYVWSGGTSMAAPLTAGAVAVARQFVQEKMGVANPSAALMKAVMIHTADDLYPGQFGEVGASKGQEILTHRPNSDEGYGRVDLANVVAMATTGTVLDDHRQGVAQGSEVIYELNLQQGSLLANLVWTDAPASENAAVTLVNDLDLVLIKPDGSEISPHDHVNNLEMLELGSLPPGHYRLAVRGFTVPQGINGVQPYALVYSSK